MWYICFVNSPLHFRFQFQGNLTEIQKLIFLFIRTFCLKKSFEIHNFCFCSNEGNTEILFRFSYVFLCPRILLDQYKLTVILYGEVYRPKVVVDIDKLWY